LRIKVAKQKTFIPIWNKNKDDSNPIEVDIEYLTVGQLDDCIDNLGRVNQKMMFRKAVKKIRNLEIETDGIEKKILTAENRLNARGLEQLYYEILGEIAVMKAGGDEKNS